MPDFYLPPVDCEAASEKPSTQVPYGVEMVGASLEWPEVRETLKQIKVAVLDTGAPQHPDLKVVGAYNFTGQGDEFDHQGHSTHVCGTIAADGQILGVAPTVQLYTYKVLNDQGAGQWPWLAQAIRQAADDGIDVINMSLGGSRGSYELEQAVKYAYQRGVVLVAAAGNEGPLGVSYPAAYDEVIATAAVNIGKAHPDFSSVGPQVEVAAAGVDVYSTWLNGKYAILSGTSMASPHVTGAAAILQAKALIRFGKKLPPDQVRLLLKVYSEDLGQFGPDPQFGFGLFTFGRIQVEEVIPKRKVVMWVGKSKALVNGQEVALDQPPVIVPETGRSLAPVRFLGEAFGATVDWDVAEQKITCTLGGGQ